MLQQSFRIQLVEWIKEIVPYSSFDKYVRKSREEYMSETMGANPETVRRSNNVAYLICTEEHSYSISANATYLGCIASARRCRAGENWTRGNDLPDGPFDRSTWEAIKDAIIRFELAKIEPLRNTAAVPDGPVATVVCRTDEEYNEAYLALFNARERFEEMKRRRDGSDKRDPEMPFFRATKEFGQ